MKIYPTLFAGLIVFQPTLAAPVSSENRAKCSQGYLYRPYAGAWKH
jgi:hypothetical protein